MKKFQGVLRYLRRDLIISMKQVVQPREISVDTAGLVHTAAYLDKFFNGRTSENEQRRSGFVWAEDLVRRCRLETGVFR